MSEISASLDKAIKSFVARNDGLVTAEMAANLRACIESSPELTEQLNLAVANGSVTSFKPMKDNGMAAGALFNPYGNVIELPLQDLSENFDSHDMAFVLGHETQHGFNAAERARAQQAIYKDMEHIAKDPDQDSYDGPVAAWQQVGRVDEAKASLAGCNAAVSQLRHEGKDVTLEAMLKNYEGRAADFVEPTLDLTGRINGYRPRDGITLNKNDMTADVNDPDNVAAMGKHFYDNDQKTVGHAKSSYANFTGATIIGYIVDRERRFGSDRMTIDLASHGMSEDKMEINGINLRRDIHQRQPYIDTSHGQERLSHFDHTYDARVSPHQLHQYVPIDLATTPSSYRQGFDDPRHPEHALYTEIKQRLPPETSPDRLTQITLAASLGGIQSGEVNRIDVMDTKVYLQGAIPGDKAAVDLTSAPPTQQATMRQFETFEQQRTQQMQQFQQMEGQITQQSGQPLTR